MIEIILFLNVALFAALVFFLFVRGYINIYSGLSIYLAFHFLVFVQRPVLVHIFDLRGSFEYMGYMPTDDIFVKTIVVANVGLLSFVFAYLLSLRFSPVSPTFNAPVFGPLEQRSMRLALLLLSPLIAYSVFLAFTLRQAVGTEVLDELGRLNMTVDPATGQTLYTDNTAYVVGGRDFALAFCGLLIYSARGRWWSYLPALFFSLLALQLGERWPIVITALVAILMTLYVGKRNTFTVKDFGVLLVVLVAFIAVGQNRGTLVRFLTTGELTLNFDLSQSSFGDHLDFANFDFLTFVLAKVPDVSKTYSYFTQYLGALTQPIPRVLWPDKPVRSPIVLVTLESYGHFTGLTTSLVGDGWISLGYAGVVMTTGFAGALYGWLFKRFCRPAISIYFFCSYFWIDALLVQWARDGGATILPFLCFSTGPIALAYGLSRVQIPRSSLMHSRNLR
jgi:oligosaccharide repeat unit polymerase